MKKTIMEWRNVPQLAKTDAAYASGDPVLRPFFRNEPTMAGFEKAILAKKTAPDHRAVVVEVLKNQYENFSAAQAITENEAFKKPKWFAVTTAHQPTLLAGPLYFVLKAITTINLAEELRKQFPAEDFVPFFVLGSEDHDLEELNHATVFGKKLTWATAQTGSVGAMKTEDFAPVLAELRAILGESEAARAIFEKIETAYLSQKTIAAATQFLLHEILGKAFGLVVLDMNDAGLKRLFLPFLKRELFEKASEKTVSKTIERLAKLGFKSQAAPREINLFYRSFLDGKARRDRLVFEYERFNALGTDHFWDEKAMLETLEKEPENFSPNVVVRPLFQEFILPNLAYVGGGGELAYWLERLDQFDDFRVDFPILVRRNSVVWLDSDATKKLERFGFSATDFFQEAEVLSKKFVERHLAVEVDLSEETAEMRSIFSKLTAKARAIDPSLEAAVGAEMTKQVAVLESWESRLRRAEKQKHEVALGQIRALKERIFPGGGLAERADSWLPFWLKTEGRFFEILKNELDPLAAGVVILAV